MTDIPIPQWAPGAPPDERLKLAAINKVAMVVAREPEVIEALLLIYRRILRRLGGPQSDNVAIDVMHKQVVAVAAAKEIVDYEAVLEAAAWQIRAKDAGLDMQRITESMKQDARRVNAGVSDADAEQ